MPNTLGERIAALVRRQPGLSEAEIAETLFGDCHLKTRVNTACRALLAAGRLRRQGRGGPADPFHYFIAQSGDTILNSSRAEPPPRTLAN